ncbi:hypothetical protein PV11_09602 [Exophiala sideris]|uniref:Uncharacterized protein n=1 Tax=Exophiala sideris TaxID=1016849 RepID=A0A0D1Y4R1_9EURO|nr:hypothetical protein PV11_09602 [Exophiala sideris]
MSISQLTAALGSASLEAMVALVNAKFDFSLVKIEAPIEFQGVGQRISTTRRNVAENGMTHVTARKLGALFEHIIPDTPELVRAYGTRASEIINSPEANPTKAGNFGFLQEHIGADATSLWAAATSGKEAIAVHLLACILANIWNDLEATSIWEELVSRRLEQLVENRQASLLSQISITREQLREWDASARSWLQCANKFMQKQRSHLTIVSNSSGLSVDTTRNLYEDVTNAWISALRITECLLHGESHEVMSGAILLALKSWHLYPDMLYLKDTRKFTQDDALFPKGALITVGVTSASPDRAGLSWSLPLAYLRYYGDPVVITRSEAENASGVTVDDFCQMILGCATGYWFKTYDDIDIAVELLVTLSETLAGNPEDGSRLYNPVRHTGWFRILTTAAHVYKTAPESKKSNMEQYRTLGARKGKKFLAPVTESPPPFFGFNSFPTLFAVFDEEWQINHLREMAKEVHTGKDPRTLVIRYKSKELSDLHGRTMWEYATVFPTPSTRLLGETGGSRHKRWTLLSDALKGHPCRCKGRCVQNCPCKEDGFCGPNCHPTSCMKAGEAPDCGIRVVSRPSIRSSISDRANAHKRSISWQIARHALLIGAQEDCVEIDYATAFSTRASRGLDDFQWAEHAYEMKTTVPWGPRHANLANYVSLSDDQEKMQGWALCYGDLNAAAVFELRERPDHLPMRENTPNMNAVITCLKSKQAFLPLNSYLWESGTGDPHPEFDDANDDEAQIPAKKLTTKQQYFSSLTFFAAVVNLYQQFPAAQVSLEILSKSPNIEWWHTTREPNTNTEKPIFSLAEAFTCITLLETGSVEVTPSSLDKVFALARDNSLFVAKTLLQDPWARGDPSAIEHLNGNVGKPGLTLMIPPPNPKTKKLDMKGYMVLPHARFDGSLHDAFANTTLHLSFTKYEQPVSSQTYGEKDARAYYRESLVSILDRGEWIADLDIQAAREDALFLRVPLCKHDPDDWLPNANYDEKRTPAKGLTAIDHWKELLDLPSTDGIVRTRGNWIGRLGAATMSIQMKKRTLVLPDGFCWKCIYDALASIGTARDLRYMTDSDPSEDEIPEGASQRKGKKRKRSTPAKAEKKSARVKESRHGAVLVA